MSRRILIAGFDFGTSFSKVVLQELSTREKRAVSFPSPNPYLLPSAVGFDGTNLYPPCADIGSSLVPYPKILSSYVADGKTGIRNLLKLNDATIAKLESEERKQFTQDVLAWYFACVLRGIRSYISSSSEWGSLNFDGDDLWVVQMCVPSGLLHETGTIEKFMYKALLRAWLLQDEPNPSLESLYDYAKWRNVCRSADARLEDKEFGKRLKLHCSVYPEAAAGAQSILRSPNSRDGKYITMDVGAGTIDLNTFYRRSGQRANGQENVQRGLDYYSVKVEPLGVARIKELEDRSPYGCAESALHQWGIQPLPEEEVMSGVRKAVVELFDAALECQPNHRTDSGKRTWDRDTFIYIWGGGSNHLPYGSTFSEGLRYREIAEPDVSHIPVPQDFPIPEGIEFGRLAIAYGLSFFSGNLEKVKLPHEIRTFSNLIKGYGQSRRSKDVIENCTCNGLTPGCVKCEGKGVVIRPEKGGQSWPPKPPPPVIGPPKDYEIKDPIELVGMYQKQILGLSAGMRYFFQNLRKSGTVLEKSRLLNRMIIAMQSIPERHWKRLTQVHKAEDLINNTMGETGFIRVKGIYESNRSYSHAQVIGERIDGFTPGVDSEVDNIMKSHPRRTIFEFMGRIGREGNGKIIIFVDKPEEMKTLSNHCEKLSGEEEELKSERSVELSIPFTIHALAKAIEVNSGDIIEELMRRGALRRENDTICEGDTRQICKKHGYSVNRLKKNRVRLSRKK